MIGIMIRQQRWNSFLISLFGIGWVILLTLSSFLLLSPSATSDYHHQGVHIYLSMPQAAVHDKDLNDSE